MKELPAALAVLRIVAGMKQSQVADLADTTKAMLCSYEPGKQTPHVRTLSRLLEALRFTYADLGEAATFVERLKARRRPME